MEDVTMKKTTPTIILALAIATMAIIGMNCSRESAPVQSAFTAEQGAWGCLYLTAGMDNEELVFAFQNHEF